MHGDEIVELLEKVFGLRGLPLLVASTGVAALIAMVAIWLAGRPFRRKPR